MAADDMTCPSLEMTGAISLLKKGGVMILATDTLPGFHARADHAEAVARIRKIKGRPHDKPLLVLAGSMSQAESVLAPLDLRLEQICARCWPGPFTLILPGGGVVADGVESTRGTLAVRIPGHRVLRQLLLGVGFPLISTSVNQEGAEPASHIHGAVSMFGGEVDGCWSPDAFMRKGSAAASALVDLSGPDPVVLREGPEPFGM